MLEPLGLPQGARVLFQGDSITDAGRGRDDDPNHILGHGYAFLIAAASGAAEPEEGWSFFNRGVSANRVADLAARWQADAIDLKPDLVSILVGINDVEGGTTGEDFEEIYDRLLRDTRASLSGVRLVLCEPFGAPAGPRAQRWQAGTERLPTFQAVVQRLALRHGATFVPTQSAFDQALQKATPEYWLWDGIHPTYAGHQVLADAWTRAINGTT